MQQQDGIQMKENPTDAGEVEDRGHQTEQNYADDGDYINEYGDVISDTQEPEKEPEQCTNCEQSQQFLRSEMKEQWVRDLWATC